ncbi:hypothetical protein CCY99_00705 [Helicobacter sp. 16-1353]|uniref:hypothetical protein n=1 Tax=Helicobacter sp. 16-1353 TaxID=2004996 RepID=UPI000DCC1290|nr:hypothetical protein [Helicobacter sp. 16-1353]RAX55252.1 hypothetical protein CCY99_00705 [Helicobacter sp. 16-1353]
MFAKLLKAIFILVIGFVGIALLGGIYALVTQSGSSAVATSGSSAVATSGSSAGEGAIMLTIMTLGLAYGVFITIRATFRGVKNTIKEKPDDEAQNAPSNATEYKEN